MSAEFDKEAKQEYLGAIRFYGKAAEQRNREVTYA
jgi:hypothetical protein